MGQLPEGRRRAPERGTGASFAAPAELAKMWRTVSEAHEVLRKRRLYWLATEVEERLGEQLALIPLLHDWVPAGPDEVVELSAAVQRYIGRDIDAYRDREADAVATCIRGMTMTRARSAVPFPHAGEDGAGGALIS